MVWRISVYLQLCGFCHDHFTRLKKFKNQFFSKFRLMILGTGPRCLLCENQEVTGDPLYISYQAYLVDCTPASIQLIVYLVSHIIHFFLSYLIKRSQMFACTQENSVSFLNCNFFKFRNFFIIKNIFGFLLSSFYTFCKEVFNKRTRFKM